MILFRVVCFLQMLITVYLSFVSIINLMETGRLYFILESVFFILMASLAVLGLSIISNNYPDKPVAGQQKSVFNWLFLLNFLLIAFLFGLFFMEVDQLQLAAGVLNKPFISLPARYLVGFGVTATILVFHFYILYGLYVLRRKLYYNFYAGKKFEFESAGEQNT